MTQAKATLCVSDEYTLFMINLLRAIITAPQVTVPKAEFLATGADAARDASLSVALSEEIRRLFSGSLAIRVVSAGSSNAEEQELAALSNPYYDIERFGIRFVASPRHADMLMVTGPVSVNMADALRHTYEAMPSPKLVVAVGDGAIHGSVFKGSYAVHDRASDIVPVDFSIPGDPPSPKTIIASLLWALHNTN